ncbi:MAG: hypothetical protein ABJB12_05745 [Pseudomonadota bacterium]
MSASSAFPVRRSSSSLFNAHIAISTPVISALLLLSSFAYAETPGTADELVAGPAPRSQAAAPVSPVAVAPPSAPASVSPVPPAPPPALPGPARAEHEAPPPSRVHQGFYLRVSSGPGVMSLSGHGPSGSASITGASETGSVAIGGALVPGLVLAGTVQGTSTSADFKGGPFIAATVTVNGDTHAASHQAQGSFGMVGVLLDWYPQPKAGWHAGLATGIGALGLKNSADESTAGGVNLSGTVFGGYDWTLGRDWALGLQLTASGGTRTKLLEDSGDHDTGYRLTPLSLGVQASVLYF